MHFNTVTCINITVLKIQSVADYARKKHSKAQIFSETIFKSL